MIAYWDTLKPPPDRNEKTKRLLDLFLVSVLLDAGAGNDWTYRDGTSGQSFSRSEGLGVASFNMFRDGFFSGDVQQPHQVDGTCGHATFFIPLRGSYMIVHATESKGAGANNRGENSTGYASKL